MRLYIVSIPRNFYQNRFINECARKKKAKIPEFLVKYRRTYVLNNKGQKRCLRSENAMKKDPCTNM